MGQAGNGNRDKATAGTRPMNYSTTMFRIIGFASVLLSGFTSRAQIPDTTTNPDHWKATVVAEKKYSLRNKEWNVDFKLTNVTGVKDHLMISNGFFMYRVKAFTLNEAGVRIGEVKTRTFSAFALSSHSHAYAEPGETIWTLCEIREWLVIENPGWYEIHADRLLSIKDANDNAVGLPVEKVIKGEPFKIEVVR